MQKNILNVSATSGEHQAETAKKLLLVAPPTWRRSPSQHQPIIAARLYEVVLLGVAWKKEILSTTAEMTITRPSPIL